MELGLREWLIIGGVIVVLLIVLDGWRRMRGSSNRLKMKIDKSLTDLPEMPEESSFNPELPGGGARVVHGHDEAVAGGRREPVMSDDHQAATKQPEFDELNVSPVRRAEAHVQIPSVDDRPLKPERSDSRQSENELENNSAIKPANNEYANEHPSKSSFDSAINTAPRAASSDRLVPPSNTSSNTDSNAAKTSGSDTSESEPTAVTRPVDQSPLQMPLSTDKRDERQQSLLTPEQVAEQDPLFASFDSFPPHHDGPSFDEMDNNLSAVRVVQDEESEPEAIPSSTDNVPTIGDIDTDTEHDRIAAAVSEFEAQETSIEDDVPLIQTLVQSKATEASFDTTEPPERQDLFAAETMPERKASHTRTPPDYSAEEDNLIDSLPEGFRFDVVDDTTADDDDYEFDYTRPVSELMRPSREETPAAQQTAMDLPPAQDTDVLHRHRPDTQDAQTSASETLHFSAIDDDQAELSGSLFTEEPRQTPVVNTLQASDTDVNELAAADDVAAAPGMGIKGQSLQKIPEADKVLVISVVAAEGEQSFTGRSLLQILLACGMRYGDMKIFHRYEDGIDEGAVQFSMTNALEPGYFDIDTMDSIETRGVTFFMSMEEPRDVMNAYECMLATATAIANNLHGILLDENRSTMRDQTKEHYRERIRKFEMRKLKKTTTA
ncbi:cell division protein ZipA [Amphritea sp. 1_MG-2023]|uniref:cell division protein ZipA n=1 Tax=Amphritea sp. 1_MG-2023 TaxID=3062670 RepID=UPI0026E406F1|nr:cell division protein ZipA [Amphritea sp. 1_MG-2023]MDO6564011.1 cell division protein ZipA [Amphritea sp. 1_MG-2023]